MRYINKQKTEYDCAVIAIMNALINKGFEPKYDFILSILDTDEEGTSDESIFAAIMGLGFKSKVLNNFDFDGPAIVAYQDDFGDDHVAFFKSNKKGYNTFLKKGKIKKQYYVIKLW